MFLSIFYKLKVYCVLELLFDMAIPLLGIYPEELKQGLEEICTACS